MDPDDHFVWERKLTALVDQIVAENDAEGAIRALSHYDMQRKRMDRIQAIPPDRR